MRQGSDDAHDGGGGCSSRGSDCSGTADNVGSNYISSSSNINNSTCSTTFKRLTGDSGDGDGSINMCLKTKVNDDAATTTVADDGDDKNKSDVPEQSQLLAMTTASSSSTTAAVVDPDKKTTSAVTTAVAPSGSTSSSQHIHL